MQTVSAKSLKPGLNILWESPSPDQKPIIAYVLSVVPVLRATTSIYLRINNGKEKGVRKWVEIPNAKNFEIVPVGSENTLTFVL